MFSEGHPIHRLFLVAILWLVIGFVAYVQMCMGQQIIPPDELAAMKALLPKVDDAPLQRILDDETTLWYTRKTLPPAYQIGSGQRGNLSPMRFADPYLNVSVDGVGTEQSKGHGKGGNANVDPPWSMRPGATHFVPNLRDFKGLWLPKRPSGLPLPVLYFPHLYRDITVVGDRAWGWDWIFPRGTVFIEVLVQHYQGADYVFEIRTRTRLAGEWDAAVYRPFDTQEEFADAVQQASGDVTLVSLISDLDVIESRLTKVFPGARSNDSRDDITVLNVSTDFTPLPTLPATVVKTLLDRPFVKSGSGWNPYNNDNPFHIVPARYDGGFAGADKISCNNCHRHTANSSRSFDRLRGWYGLIRGNRGKIFSWHPIDPEMYVGSMRGKFSANHPYRDSFDTGITANGQKVMLPIYLRKEFVEAGMVERFIEARHNNSEAARWYYHQVKQPSTP